MGRIPESLFLPAFIFPHFWGNPKVWISKIKKTKLKLPPFGAGRQMGWDLCEKVKMAFF
ncbi:MAG: hypothetical protein LBF22_00915 [Deltaproteobacteria bacterium]|jgi:hypothetical protein|nr:hypothetical protein [Deltaproteobacteria bacterium]